MTKATDNQIINAALSSVTMHEAARTCSLHPTSFILRAKRLGVYKPNPGRVGVIRSKDEYKNIRIPLHEILQGKHPQYSTSHLRRRLFDEFNWERKCEKCFTDDQGISFELDHKDGDHTNHKFGNLQILCPNCHSKTPTFAGRNKKRKR